MRRLFITFLLSRIRIVRHLVLSFAQLPRGLRVRFHVGSQCCLVLSRLRSAGRGSPGSVAVTAGSSARFTGAPGASAMGLFQRSANCRQFVLRSGPNASHLKFADRNVSLAFAKHSSLAELVFVTH